VLGGPSLVAAQSSSPDDGSGLVKPPVQPAPWKKFPTTGLGGVPAQTPSASPGNMLDRRPTRHLFPAQPAPNPQPAPSPTTPVIGAPGRPGLIIDRDGRPWGRDDRTRSDLIRRPGYPHAYPIVRPPYRWGYPVYWYSGGLWQWYGSGPWVHGYGTYPYSTVIVWPASGFDLSAGQPQTQPAPATPSAPSEPPPAPTTMELAARALAQGDPAEAERLFRVRLSENDNDALAQRGLALALLERRRVDEAIATLAQTYGRYPWLATFPIDPASMGGDHNARRNRFGVVMQRANQIKTASSLLAATVLAQGEGRLDVARKLLDRASAAGLDAPVGDALRAAMGK
jgi:hypothetical protein